MSAIDLAYLVLISDNDREFEEELLQVYIDDCQEHLQQAALAIQSLAWENLAREAHHLKGASGNVGAQEMQSLALALETAAKAQDDSSSRDALDRMQAKFEEVKQLFKERYRA
ncbi:MAG: Hpt domain-containing protein [Cyanobacteria bacterium M5B4]|nr:MAG: Hpt domain-containing protein [Cyanobacteria bacterium M5B4]